MNPHEYRRKTHPQYYHRSLPLTIVTALLFVFVAIGIVASWRYLGRDLYVIGSVIVPSVIIALLLLVVAVDGCKHIIKEAYAGILEIIFWWRP